MTGGELPRPPEKPSKAAGLLLTDAKLAKLPLTGLSSKSPSHGLRGVSVNRLSRPAYPREAHELLASRETVGG